MILQKFLLFVSLLCLTTGQEQQRQPRRRVQAQVPAEAIEEPQLRRPNIQRQHRVHIIDERQSRGQDGPDVIVEPVRQPRRRLVKQRQDQTERQSLRERPQGQFISPEVVEEQHGRRFFSPQRQELDRQTQVEEQPRRRLVVRRRQNQPLQPQYQQIQESAPPEALEKPRELRPSEIVVREVNENDGTGKFYMLRETKDGGRHEQVGYLDESNHQVIEGLYTEITPEGPRNVAYIADKTGYHPVGNHLPKSPRSLG